VIHAAGYSTSSDHALGRQGKDSSFFEKKKQKTFAHCVQRFAQYGNTCAGRNGKKFFGSFFPKRTAFLVFLLPAIQEFTILRPTGQLQISS
jgi:hypothetical protein